MRVLILGDVVGRPGRRAVRELVQPYVNKEGIDLVIANAENAAGGMGVDVKSAEEFFSAGVHVLTSGNHIWKKKEIYSLSEWRAPSPAAGEFSRGGAGCRVVQMAQRSRRLSALIINLQGRVFMPNHVDDPFRCVDRDSAESMASIPLLSSSICTQRRHRKRTPWVGILTAERLRYYGTHTHIQTADERDSPERNGVYHRSRNVWPLRFESSASNRSW